MEIKNLPDLRQHGWTWIDTDNDEVRYEKEKWRVSEFTFEGFYTVKKNGWLAFYSNNFKAVVNYLQSKKLIK